MGDTLKDVGAHFVHSSGHYEATVNKDGGVTIETIFDEPGRKHTVSLSSDKWDRLVAWVEWRRKNRVSKQPVESN